MPSINDLSPTEINLLNPNQVNLLSLNPLASPPVSAGTLTVGKPLFVLFTTRNLSINFKTDDYSVFVFRNNVLEIPTVTDLRENTKELYVTLDTSTYEPGDFVDVFLLINNTTAHRTVTMVSPVEVNITLSPDILVDMDRVRDFGQIILYQEENRTISYTIRDKEGNPLDMDGTPLRLVAHNSKKPTPDEFFAVNTTAVGTTASFSFTTAQTANQLDCNYSIRDMSTNSVIGYGSLRVIPSRD